MNIFPWLSLVAIIWLQAISATNSDFSAYSSQLKSRLGISQVQLNYLAIASDAGKLFGWCSGIAATYIPLPVVLLIGSAIGLIGYGIPFLFLANKIASLSYWHVLILSKLAGNSICWINTACYVASMRKFPSDHGAVIALSTSYSALSAKIYIALSELISQRRNRKGNDSIYLLLDSVTPLVVGVIVAPLLRDTKQSVAKTQDGLFPLFVIAGATGAYSILVSVVPVIVATSRVLAHVILLGMLASIAVVPLLMAVQGPCGTSWRIGAVEEEVELGEMGAREEEVVETGMEKAREHGVRELLRNVDFWLYFWVYLCGGTLGLVYMNNLGQISQSRGVPNSVLLSISSSFGFFGKLASALVSVFQRSRYMVSKPASMALLMAPMATSFFLLLDPTITSLFVSTAIIGLCSGAMTSIAVSMTAELFGTKHFGMNHNILITNIPIGSFLFGYMAGYNYDKEGGQEHGHRTCVGVQCYHRTFVLWGLICLFGTVVSVALYYRTEKRVMKPSMVV